MDVDTGMYDCALALGVEKLSDPDKAKSLRAFNSAVDVSELAEIEKRLGRSSEGTSDRSLFMDLYLSMLNSGASDSREAVGGITREQMALVSVKNHYHGSLNSYAQYREAVTLEQVLQSRRVVGPLTVLMCSPLGDGAAAVLITSEEFARSKGLKGPRVDASVLVSGRGDDRSMAPSTRRAATQAYEMAGISPEQRDVARGQASSWPADLSNYAATGFHPPAREPTHVP